ncbi:MAG: tetratricopeptide (TPR) repeat protein [Gammaproteobacteria bacterium]|jgi:tetratricopeptide (TPR) repeat protein
MSNCNELDLNLVDYLEGELPATQTQSLDEHVASCAACRESVQDYRQILSAYGELEPEDVPEQIATEILSAARSAVATKVPGALEVPIATPVRTIPIWKSALAFAASVLAVFAFVQMSDQGELNVEQLLQRGFEREANGEVAGAIEDLEGAVDLDPTHDGCADALMSIAQLHSGLGDPGSALAALDELAAVYPAQGNSFDALILRIDAYQQSGDLALAGDALALANAAFPVQAQAWLASHESQEELRLTTLSGLGYLGDEELGYSGPESLSEEAKESLEALGYTD